ncbi:hypothetical protein ILUMI_19133, partial [Ignelater luminosus]
YTQSLASPQIRRRKLDQLAFAKALAMSLLKTCGRTTKQEPSKPPGVLINSHRLII